MEDKVIERIKREQLNTEFIRTERQEQKIFHDIEHERKRYIDKKLSEKETDISKIFKRIED